MLRDEYEYIVDSSRLPEIATKIMEAKVIALDLETTGFSPVKGDKIRLCSVNTSNGVYVIDVFKAGLGPVAAALHNSTCVKIGANLKFDQKFLLFYHGVELWPVFDCTRASYIMHNGRKMAHDLWAIQEREILKRPRTEDLGGSNWSANELSQEQKDYAADDVISLPSIREVQKAKLNQAGLNRVALIEFGALLPEGAVELNGFRLNAADWEVLAHKNEIRRKELQEELWREMPDPNSQMALPFGKKLSFFNLDSPLQMLQSLRMMGVRLEDTREISLAMAASKSGIINKILDYREVAQRVKSFGVDYTDYINPVTGRVHPDYFGFLRAARYSCSHPNLSQIPRDKAFRACFQAEEGNTLVLADYSGVEMRILAEVANDRRLTQVFIDKKDVHKVTASILLNIPYEQIDKQKKQQAKPVNFGFAFGMGAAKLVLYAKSNYGVTLSLREATEFRTKYMDYYANIPKWHAKTLEEGLKSKLSVSKSGRIRFLEDEGAYNEHLNTPIQSLGADGLKTSLRNVYFRLKKEIGHAPVRTVMCLDPKVRMVHHVHDEIILETKNTPELVDMSKKELVEGMHDGMQIFLEKVPVEVEAVSGPNWASK